MRRHISFFMVIALVLFLAGCNNGLHKEVVGDEKTAKEFVEDQGYKVTSLLGMLDQYKLSKSMLYGPGTFSYQQTWAVQETEPDHYFGKEISVYGFIVTNHPLEKQYEAKTGVYIMLAEGKVIGGYSFPDIEGLVGSVSSLKGKTLEELTGMNYQQWTEEWSRKYGQ